jgi:hypothetical protein
MPLSGTFSTMPLTDLLQWLGDTRRSGLLKVELEFEERCIRLEHGSITGYGSDDPLARDIGRLCLVRGLVTEPQLIAVAQQQAQSQMPIGDVLVAAGLIDAEKLERTLARHVEETVLGLFLWPHGRFSFVAAGEAEESGFEDWMPPEYQLHQPIDIREILFEGMRRQDEWHRIAELLPSDDVTIRALAPSDAFPILMEIAAHAEPPTLGDLLAERGDTRYALCEQLFRAHRQELIEIGPVVKRNPVTTARGTTTVDHLVQAGRALHHEKQHDEAAALVRSALQLDAWSAEARGLLSEIEREQLAELRQAMPAGRVPVMIPTPAQAMKLRIGPRERKLLSHVNGTWDVAALTLTSGLGEIETLRTLRRLLQAEVVRL